MELKDIKGVGIKTLEKLAQLGIESPQSLLDFLPKKYIDFTTPSSINDIVEGEYVLLKIQIVSVSKNLSKQGKNYIKCDAKCDNVELEIFWFNSPYLEYSLKKGEWVVWGEINFASKKYKMINPQISDTKNKYKLKDVMPIYPLKDKIGDVAFRKILEELIKNIDFNYLLQDKFDLKEIYKKIHFPKSVDEMNEGQTSLAIYKLSLQFLAYKKFRKIQNKQPYNILYPQYVDKYLPYNLTKSQKDAVCDIVEDFNSNNVFSRMILGDVGSGKTIVAFYAMIAVVMQKSFQCVMIAPTEILVKQHFEKFNKLFSSLGIKTAFLSSSVVGKDRENLLNRLKNGQIEILFATHSCFSANVQFLNLALMIVDEVHKFGVKQKAILQSKGQGVNCLLMSATPLPRAFAMTVFGDLKVSKLYKANERKTTTETYILSCKKVEDMYAYIARQIKNSSKAIIVVPRIVDNDDNYSLQSVYKKLCKDYVDKSQIAMLFGSMTNFEKDNVITKFKNGEIKIIVSTSVIEVGIDVPDCDIIAIMRSDKFGLASLHQLRGRVGRDGRHSECYLHCSSLKVPERLKNLKNCCDGVKLSELDAENRGYGDFIGFNQSGKSGFENFSIKITKEIIFKAKQIADQCDLMSFDEKLLNEMLARYSYFENVLLN